MSDGPGSPVSPISPSSSSSGDSNSSGDSGSSGGTEALDDIANDTRVLVQFNDYKAFQSRLKTTIKTLIKIEQDVYSSRSAPPDIKFTDSNAIAMRRDIGIKSDSLYLRLGMSCLWSGEDKTALFPSTLPSIQQQMEESMYSNAIKQVQLTIEEKIRRIDNWIEAFQEFPDMDKTELGANGNQIDLMDQYHMDEILNVLVVDAHKRLFIPDNDNYIELYNKFPRQLRNTRWNPDNTNGALNEKFESLTNMLHEIYQFIPSSFNPTEHTLETTDISTLSSNRRQKENKIGWALLFEESDNNYYKKLLIPMLFALCDEDVPHVIKMDIANMLTFEFRQGTPSTTIERDKDNLKVEYNNQNWTQDYNGTDRIKLRATIEFENGRLLFKYTQQLIVLKEYRDILKKYRSDLESQKTCVATLHATRKRTRETLGEIDQDQRAQRNAIWSDAHRELVISGDRLYAFIRVMAGTLNEDVTAALNVEDRSLDASQQEYRKQRSELIRQQRVFSQRVINDLLTSIFKASNFRVDLSKIQSGGADNESGATNLFTKQIVIVNDESLEQVRELSESSSVQFLGQNVNLLRAFENLKGKPMPLNEFVIKVQEILHAQNLEAQSQLARTQYQRDQNSLEYLSEPRNSYVVRMKNEAFAAIRNAFDEFKNEWRMRQIKEDPPLAWEMIEGGPDELTDAFAQFCAYKWSNSRLFSSSTAAFIGVTPARINLIVLRTALSKLINRAYNFKRDVMSKPIYERNEVSASEMGGDSSTGAPAVGVPVSPAIAARAQSRWGPSGPGFVGPGVVWNWN
jgi:hypothetical protein